MATRALAGPLCLLLAMPARSESLPDPDREAAMRHFDRSVDLYAAKNYAGALLELETAKRIAPLPTFDFNIARCHERMEAWREAADAYERFAASLDPGDEADEIRARIATLRYRAKELERLTLPPVTIAPPVKVATLAPPPLAAAKPVAVPLPSPPPMHRRRPWWPFALGGSLLLGTVALGFGIGFGMPSDPAAPISMTTDGNYVVVFP